MIRGLLGKKVAQTQTFTTDGKRIPVTDIVAGPATVVQIKSIAKEGYWAVQLGFDHKTNKNTSQPIRGHLKKTGQGNFSPRFLREIKLVVTGEEIPYKVGDQVTVDTIFQVGDAVKVTGTSKAKGFQGGVKRHGFAGGPRTHGQSDRERAPGSIGQTTTPGRVYRGKRMAGHTGGETVTISGLKIIEIDPHKQQVRVKGLIPGQLNSLVIIQKQ